MNRADARPVKHWILGLAIVAVLIAVFTGWNRVESKRETAILAGGC